MQRIETIDKEYVTGIDESTVPEDPEEFLTWWWETYAKACTECPLSETRNHVVKPDGLSTARIMIIGEGPGFLEDLTGVPLVGPMELRTSHCGSCNKYRGCFDHRLIRDLKNNRYKAAVAVTCDPAPAGKLVATDRFYIKSSGSIFDGVLLEKWKFNFPRHNWIRLYNETHEDKLEVISPWYITNSILCRNTDATRTKDQPPLPLARKKCLKWLTFQWAAVQPELIICFGRSALASMIGETASKTIAPNTLIETKFGPVLFEIHPAATMREKNSTAKAYGYAKIGKTLEKALTIIGVLHD